MVPGWPAPLQRQVQVLLNNFVQDPPAVIAVASIELLRRAHLMRPARFEALGNYPMERALVLMQNNEPQLWVNPADDTYRDIFRRFAAERLGVTTALTGDAFNFDHVFPRTAAITDGMSHVRMIAILPRPNQSAGRTLEKRMAQRARDAAGRKRIRSATWMTIGKAAGFEGWEELPGEDDAGNASAVVRLFAYLSTVGISPPAGALEHRLTAGTLSHIR